MLIQEQLDRCAESEASRSESPPASTQQRNRVSMSPLVGWQIFG